MNTHSAHSPDTKGSQVKEIIDGMRNKILEGSRRRAADDVERGMVPADALANFIGGNLSYLLRSVGVGEAVAADEVERREALGMLKVATEHIIDSADADLTAACMPIFQYLALSQEPGRRKIDLYGIARAIPKYPQEPQTQKMQRMQNLYGWLINPEKNELFDETERGVVRRLWILAECTKTIARFNDAEVANHSMFNHGISNGTRHPASVELASDPTLNLPQLSDALFQIVKDSIEKIEQDA